MADWVAGRVIDKRRWNDTHYSVQIDAPVETFRAGQFARVGLDLGEERVGRPYSFVNAPGEQPLEIFFNIVPEGPLTSRLAELQSGDDVWVTAKANGNLTLDSVPDEARHLWLLATGTAIGPFLSILKTAEPWERFDRVVLAYGVRHAADLAYQDRIAALQHAYPEQLTYIPLVTREAVPEAIQARIPAALQDGRLERRAGIALDGVHAHVMLCGNAGMIADASGVLEARGLKRNLRREPGQFSTEKYH
jgi:ferredoxin--NADP+ reductase